MPLCLSANLGMKEQSRSITRFSCGSRMYNSPIGMEVAMPLIMPFRSHQASIKPSRSPNASSVTAVSSVPV